MTPIQTLPDQTLSIPDAAPRIEGYRSVLQNPNFVVLWVGQIFSQLGDRIVFVVFITMIVQYFGASDSYNSYLYIAFTIPAMLLTAIAGVFVDRWPRRAVLVITNVLRAIFVAFLPLAAKGNLGSVYSLAFLLSAATQFFVPAEAATIPMIVKKTQLIPANSLFTTTMMASVIFGFALGDPLINIFSLKEVHWAIVGLFTLSAIILMFVKTPDVLPKQVRTAEGGLVEPENRPLLSVLKAELIHYYLELKDGIQYIQSNALLWHAILKLSLLFSTVVAMCILFVSFAKSYLFDDPVVAARKFAYIITFSGIGMATGAVLVGKLSRMIRPRLLVFAGFLEVGCCLLLLTFVDMIPKPLMLLSTPALHLPGLFLDPIHLTARMVFTYGLATLMGVGAAFVAIPLQSLIHELIPEDKRGKVMGVQFTMLSTSSTLPVLIAGLGTEQFGVIPMLLMMGIPFVLLGVWGLMQLNQSGRDHVTASSHASPSIW